MQALHPLRAILTACVKHSARAFLLAVQALHPLLSILTASAKYSARAFLLALQALQPASIFRPVPSRSLAYGRLAFGHTAFGPPCLRANSLRAHSFRAHRLRLRAPSIRCAPLTLDAALARPLVPSIPSPHPYKRGVDLGGTYTVLATEPVHEAFT